MNEDLRNGLAAYNTRLADAGGRALQGREHPEHALAVVMYSAQPYGLHVPPMGVARLSINLSPARVVGGVDGERPRTYQAARHSLFLTPAGAGVRWNKTSSSRHINIYFHARAFEQPPDAAWSRLLGDGVPLLNTALPGSGPLLDMLAAELAADDPFAAEAVDSLARLILLRLARRQGQGRAVLNPLTPPLQARLRDFMQARLDHRLTICDLAAVVDLPPNRFAQAFTRAMGQPPHQHLLHLRLERAVQLLQGSNLGLADIAAACGFASQQHMTQVMRRRMGSTPARVRSGQGSAC